MSKFDKISEKMRANQSIKQAKKRKEIKEIIPLSMRERWELDYGAESPFIQKLSLRDLDNARYNGTTVSYIQSSATEIPYTIEEQITKIYEEFGETRKEMNSLQNKVTDLTEVVGMQQKIIEEHKQSTQSNFGKLEIKLKKLKKYASALKWAQKFINKSNKTSLL